MSEIIFFEPKGTLFLKDLFDDISKDIYKIKIFDIKTDDIYPDFSGIRPKIEFTGDFNDFKIYKDKLNGYNTFINLIGIDSPGLTSCLAISDYVFNLIQE